MQLSLLDQPGLRVWSPSHGASGAPDQGGPGRGSLLDSAPAASAPVHSAPVHSAPVHPVHSAPVHSAPVHPVHSAPFRAARPEGLVAAVGAEPGARRIELGRGAWVELVPSWLPEQASLFELLARTADWEQHRRTMYDRIVEVPRLVAGLPGEASSAFGLTSGGDRLVQRVRHRAPAREVREAAAELRWLAVTLSHRYQRTLTDVSLAYYRDGRDSVAYHGDKLGAGRMDSVVAILSLGARRRFLLRPSRQERSSGPTVSQSEPRRLHAEGARERSMDALGGEETLTFELGEGDLLVMGGTCQETFEHAIPKAKFAAPRIAVMFRQAEHSLARRAARPPSLRLVR